MNPLSNWIGDEDVYTGPETTVLHNFTTSWYEYTTHSIIKVLVTGLLGKQN